MAAVALVCGLACYVVSFAMLERAGRGRNFYTYSTFGILLIIAGSRILLSGAPAAVAWSMAALACVWAGGHFGSLTLQVHGGLYLLLAVGLSGVLQTSGRLLVGRATWSVEEGVALAAGAAVAVVAYWVAVRDRAAAGHFPVLRLGMAGLAAWLMAGLAAGVLTFAYHAALGPEATHAYCATIRTGILGVAALGLAWAGARWKLEEWPRLVYPTMALGAYRLLTDDLRQERKAALFLSLLIYGTALMVLPRLRRSRA
jgi:hypothetical protein